jgi:hypothetical protein
MIMSKLQFSQSDKLPLIFIISEKGGVRKTFTAMAVIDYLTIVGIECSIFQIDRQGRLGSAFPTAVTIDLPAVDEFRTNELADGIALSPLDDAIANAHNQAIVVDVGANLDGRLATLAVSAGWDSEVKEANRRVIVLTPFLMDSDSIELASRSARRMRVAFPLAKIIPVACLTTQSFTGFPSPEMKQLFDNGFGMDAFANMIVHPPIYSSALRLVETSGSTPQRYIELDPRTLESKAGMPRAAIRQAQGDIARYVVELREELQRALPFRGQQAR